MEETMTKSSALKKAEKNLLRYFQTHDASFIAEDAVFTDLSTGQRYHGRAEIGAVLHYLYHVAFDAHVETTGYMITEDKAQVEGFFIGKHTGVFADIPATGREVSVPLTVVYDLKDGLIQEARIYLLSDIMMRQLGMTTGGQVQKTTYLVRDVFHLKFGHFKEAKKLIEQAFEQGLAGTEHGARVLTDFTGDAYRLILEEGFTSLQDYETTLGSELKKAAWQKWYESFKPLVEKSHREILKQVI